MSVNESKHLSYWIDAEPAQMTTRKGEQVSRGFALIPGIDYEDLARRLGASRSTIYSHVKAFVKLGILIQFRKHRARGKMVYAVGYFLAYKGRHRAIPFVNETMKPALREFNVHR